MGHVTAADGKPVAVAANGDDRQIGIGRLDALGGGQRPPVHHVQAVGVDEFGETAGTADPGYDDHVLRIQVPFSERALQSRKHTEISAAGTPCGLYFAPVVFELTLDYPAFLSGPFRRPGFFGVGRTDFSHTAALLRCIPRCRPP